MVRAMGVGSGFYKFLLVLHILTAIAGFGITLMAPLFAREVRARRGKEGHAIFEAFFEITTKYALMIIYVVPVLGILLILTSDDAWKFSQGWISMALFFYIVAIGIVHAVHLPNLRAMNGLLAQLAGGPPPGAAGGGPPPQVAELEARGKRAAAIGGVLNILLVVIIFLMVYKPGV